MRESSNDSNSQYSYFIYKNLFEIQENPRAPTPDTESEQPTDTELSESKTGSLEQRTPTPEIEAELDSESVNIAETAVSNRIMSV